MIIRFAIDFPLPIHNPNAGMSQIFCEATDNPSWASFRTMEMLALADTRLAATSEGTMSGLWPIAAKVRRLVWITLSGPLVGVAAMAAHAKTSTPSIVARLRVKAPGYSAISSAQEAKACRGSPPDAGLPATRTPKTLVVLGSWQVNRSPPIRLAALVAVVAG